MTTPLYNLSTTNTTILPTVNTTLYHNVGVNSTSKILLFFIIAVLAAGIALGTSVIAPKLHERYLRRTIRQKKRRSKDVAIFSNGVVGISFTTLENDLSPSP